METGTSNEPSTYLTFMLDREVFAVDIAKVREVIAFSGVTKVPRTPEYMRGVINLRGNVVPVLDLRMKLGMGQVESTVDACVIIAEVELAGERMVLGALADSVQEVLALDSAQIVPPPRMGTRVDSDVITGMGKRDEDFLIILDVDKVFSLGDVSHVDAPTDIQPGDPAISSFAPAT